MAARDAGAEATTSGGAGLWSDEAQQKWQRYRGKWYNVLPQLLVLAGLEIAVALTAAAVVLLFTGLRQWGVAILALQAFLVALPIPEPQPSGGGPRKGLAAAVGWFCTVVGRDYYPVDFAFDDGAEFEEGRNYVFAYEPHSVLPIGIVMFSPWAPSPLISRCGWMEGRLRLMSSSAAFYLPVVRHIIRWMGVHPIDRDTFRRSLREGYSVALVPGGVGECVVERETDEEVYMVQKRKGFVKLALEAGTPVVPVVAYGQHATYDCYCPKHLPLFRTLCKLVRFAPMLYWGRGFSPLPKSTRIRVVCGAPIPVPPPTSNPPDELVAAKHEEYVRALCALYDRHKGKHPGEVVKMRIC